jgi:cytochrome c oxidase subunit 2
VKFPLFPEQASNLAKQVDSLYLFLTGVSALILVIIFGLIFFFLAKYRRGTPANRAPAKFSTMKLEIAWTVIPLLLVTVMFAWGANVYLEMQREVRGGINIHVVGKQWMWKVQHPQGNREINELHVPLGEIIQLTMTSQDVIHSFFMPAFRLKYDVVPGRYTKLWFVPTKAGVYHLFCAEFCGTKHSEMVGRIVVMEPEDYARWLASGEPQEPIVAGGERRFRELGCSGCHSPNSLIRSPLLEGLYGRPVPLQNGEIVRADEQYIRDSILLPQSQITAGYEPLMPTFQGVLTEEEILQLVAYIRSLSSKRPEGNR